MSRFRLDLTLPFSLVLILCLVFVTSAGARPHGSVARLSVDVGKVPGLSAGGAAKVKVKVAAKGPRAVPGVVLVAKPSKGVTVKPSKARLGRLAPGTGKTAAFKISVAASAVEPRLAFVAKGDGVAKVRQGVKLTAPVRAPTPKPTPAPVPPAPPASALAGRYFWISELIGSTTYVHAYYVVDNTWIYRGVPAGGLPACGAQTASGEGDGCLPYTWSEATGALTVGGEGGEYKVGSHVLKVGSKTFLESVPPEAGTLVEASGEYLNGVGLCPTSCTFVSVGLRLTPSGAFAKSAAVSGTTTEGSFASLPPDQHGTYAIDQRGRIVFTYADGHTVTQTITFMLDDSDNVDPNYGIILDGSLYWGPHSEV